MRSRPVSLLQELETLGSGIVCLVGGGGKSSLLYAVGDALAQSGKKALCTTTTKIRRLRNEFRFSTCVEDDAASLRVPPKGVLLAARPAPPGGDASKLYGYSAFEVDALFARRIAPWIIVEADGAAGRPLKAPAEHEPCVPAQTNIVIGVIGLSCFLSPFTAKQVFRAERFAALTGLNADSAVTPEAAATLAFHPQGLFKNSPAGAVRLIFCNQCDLPGATQAGIAFAEAVFSRGPAPPPYAVYLGAVHREQVQCRKFAPDSPL